MTPCEDWNLADEAIVNGSKWKWHNEMRKRKVIVPKMPHWFCQSWKDYHDLVQGWQAVCLSTSQQVIRWASAWLTSRKLRPSHLMTSLNSIKLIRSTHFMTNRVWMALIRSVPNLQCFDYLMEMVKKSCLVSWWHRFTPHNDQWILPDFAQYTVLHGNTILRWLIILKQENLKRRNCDCFY